MSCWVHRCSIVLAVAMFAHPCKAQFDNFNSAGRGVAMGGVSVMLNDLGSAVENDAGLAYIERGGIVLDFRERFLETGMSTIGAAAAFILNNGTLALSVNGYGDSDYSEQRLSAHYAMKVGERVGLGVGMHYFHTFISDPYYPHQNLVTFSAAMQVIASEAIRLGVRVFNPIAVRMDNTTGFRLPAIFSIGVSYVAAEGLLLAAEIEKNSVHPVTPRLGLEYGFLSHFHVRAGLSTSPMSYSFGVGVGYEKFAVDMAAAVHSRLGVTPSVALRFNF